MRWTFHVLAQSEPEALPRLIAPFAQRGITPRKVDMLRDNECMHVEIVIDGDFAPQVIETLAEKMREMFLVHSVRFWISEIAERRAADRV